MFVVSSKVASKALGLVAADRESAVAAATVRVVAERTMPDGRVTRVVESVVGSGDGRGGRGRLQHRRAPTACSLLPTDPDGVCASLLAALQRGFGVTRLGVVLSDTSGRPWRVGQVDFALGAAGMSVVDDLRGAVDADGRALAVTARAVADEVAAAADLVKGKVDAVPVALVRGAGRLRDRCGGARRWTGPGPDRPGDWFATGDAEAIRAALGVTPGSELVRTRRDHGPRGGDTGGTGGTSGRGGVVGRGPRRECGRGCRSRRGRRLGG